MLGQQSPTIRSLLALPGLAVHGVFPRGRRRTSLLCAIGCLVICLGWQSKVRAEPTSVRLRFAWGGDRKEQHRWTGRITVEGGSFADLQPLGQEPDEPGAMWLAEDGLHIAPRRERGFDGCDVTISAEPTAAVVVQLRSGPDAEPKILRATLARLIRDPFRQTLTSANNLLLIHRAPGDTLAVHVQRDSLVFDPGEAWQLELQPDLGHVREPVSIEVRLHAAGSEDVLWESRHAWAPPDPSSNTPSWSRAARPRIPLTVPCPESEGVYRLSISAHRQAGFTDRLLGETAPAVLASRDVEFIVVAPDPPEPPLQDHWSTLLSLDPANPGWWEHLPSWARWSHLPGLSPATLGNVRPVTRPHPAGELVELPPTGSAAGEPAWQAYTLPIRQPGEPYLIEIDYPAELPQHLLIHVIEPDAAGRILSVGRSAGFRSRVSESRWSTAGSRATAAEFARQRILFWPRTRAPLLLIANGHPTLPAQYGQIRLLQQNGAGAAASSDPHDTVRTKSSARPQRLIAAYVARPTFAKNFGSDEVFDAASGLSVESWSTFLRGGRRLAQFLHYRGMNGVLLSVAADGGALYPSRRLVPSPRYDQGMLATSAPDPVRKDVLELLLRIADRQGLKVIPTLQWASPLPQLEKRLQDVRRTGLEWVGHDGRTWLEAHAEHNGGAQGAAPYYNPLNPDVQAELEAIVVELASRYQQHVSLAGVAIQLSGNGYSMLPGLAWGFDDQTVHAYSKETGVELAGSGEKRFQRRAEQLLGAHRESWQRWRAQRMTSLYQRIGQQLRSQREDLQLVLTTEQLFASTRAQRQVRLAIAGNTTLAQALVEQGIDWDQLGKLMGVTLLCPRRLTAGGTLASQALDLRINRAGVMDSLLESSDPAACLFYHPSRRVRLRSFDAQSPAGEGKTHLSLVSCSSASGAEARRPLVSMLARHDVQSLFDGGEQLSLGSQEVASEVYRTFRQLPRVLAGAGIQTQTKTKQPVVMRIYREADATTVCLINESPWQVQTELGIQCQQQSHWSKLGESVPLDPAGTDLEIRSVEDGPAGEADLPGRIEAGSHRWPVSLRPYDLVAWRFETAHLQLKMHEVRTAAVASQELEQRIEAIEVRARNLDVQRPYEQLLNPGFELEVAGQPLFGWQPRIGAVGTVALDAQTKHLGSQSLHLTSQDDVGVAVQSNLFPMPATGQLVLRAYVHAERIEEQTRFYIKLEDAWDGRTYRQYTTLDRKKLAKAENGWSGYEFGVNDVPFGSGGKMRVQFYLAGSGEIWLDDVQLSDLRFAESQRVDLVKQISAAKKSLKAGQVMDCLRLVDDYGSRYLVAHVAPADPMDLKLAKKPKQPASEEVEQPGLGQRIRGFLPKLWR